MRRHGTTSRHCGHRSRRSSRTYRPSRHRNQRRPLSSRKRDDGHDPTTLPTRRPESGGSPARAVPGDIATLLDFVDRPSGGPPGWVLEIFNAVGDSIAVVAVPADAIEPLRADEVLAARPLAESVHAIDYAGWIVLETSCPSHDCEADCKKNVAVVRKLFGLRRQYEPHARRTTGWVPGQLGPVQFASAAMGRPLLGPCALRRLD